jgi:glycosyltransferase involved in cell wall biosynthesis
MKLLLVHQNFPGQYKHIAARFGADPGVQVVAIGEQDNLSKRPDIPGVQRLAYRVAREVGKEIHPYLRNIEAAVLRGQAVARIAMQLRAKGFVPDLICAHPAWGEALYLREIFPDSRILAFFEFYYLSQGADMGFDPEFPATLDDHLRIRTWNMVQQSSFFSADAGITPTRWQASVYPAEFQAKMNIIHDGIDTDTLRPNPAARFPLPDGRVLTRSDEVISFISRGLEPYRGFHLFMRALPELMRRRPNAQIVIVGGDTPSYGRRPKDAANWREYLLREVGDQIDPNRLHFVGKIPYPAFVSLLQVARAHVYLSYPFVLSWSMLEAMAAGAPIIASRTPPVTEFIRHETNGLLFDFFDRQALVEAVCRALDDADLSQALTRSARQTIVEGYDLERVCLPAQIKLMHALARPLAEPKQ